MRRPDAAPIAGAADGHCRVMGKGGEAVRLRPMTPADVEPTANLVLAGGWADFRSQFAFAVSSPACACLVAEIGGQAIGVGVGTRNGTVGWVGPIFTAPEYRDRGVGRALTAAVARRLEGAGCDALLLAASELGRPVYERLGFAAVGRYHVLSGPASALPVGGATVRAIGPDDVPGVHSLDRWATGEDRGHLLATFARPGWVATDRDGDRLLGYALATPWGAGPIVAADPAAALALLRRSATVGADGSLVAVVPGENATGRAMLAGLGFVEVRSLPRMCRGRDVAWHPEAIWRLFSFGMG